MLNTYCWAMEKILFTTQYKTRPDGNWMEIHARNTGMMYSIIFCDGSPVDVIADMK